MKAALRHFAWSGLAASIGTVLLVARNLYQYGKLLGIRPGVERNASLALEHTPWALRDLAWSFVLAFGRTYDVRPPLLAYLFVFGPLLVLALWGWRRFARERPQLFTTAFLAAAIAVLASLHYSLSYPPGKTTSWGRNLYPVLPLLAVLIVGGWRSLPALPIRRYAPFISIGVLAAGSLWGLWHLIAMY